MMAKFVLLEGLVISLCCYVPKQSTSEETNFQLRATSPASVIRDSNIKDMTFIKHKCFTSLLFVICVCICLLIRGERERIWKIAFPIFGIWNGSEKCIPIFWEGELEGCYCRGWLGTGIPAHHWMLVSAFAHVEVESGVVSGVNRSGWGLVWGGFWCLV